MSEPVEQLEAWAGALLGKLSPAERRRLARQIGLELARSQRQRIKAQLNPDGSRYEPRKAKPAGDMRQRKGEMRRRAKSRAMFAKLSRAQELNVLTAAPDLVEVGFRRARTARIARVHQEGLVDRVAKNPRAPSVRYPKRQLLGFTEADRERIARQVLDALETGGV